jgi:tetratricopeptide (TPR) repeat protein
LDAILARAEADLKAHEGVRAEKHLIDAKYESFAVPFDDPRRIRVNTLLIQMYEKSGRDAQAFRNDLPASVKVPPLESKSATDSPDSQSQKLIFALKTAERLEFKRQYASAVSIYEGICSDSQSPEDAKVLAFERLMRAYCDVHDYQHAEEALKSRIQILEGKSDEESRFRLTCATALLAHVYAESKRYSEAEVLFKKCIPELDNRKGRESLELVLALADYADFERKQGHLMDSAKLYKRATTILEHSKTPRSKSTVRMVRAYAKLLRTLKREEEAEHQDKLAEEIESASDSE